MRSRTVRLIAAKELLDTLRDRRTLFVALVLPLLLYPALLLGLTQIISATRANLQDQNQKVLFGGTQELGELEALLRKGNLEPMRIESFDRGAEVQAEADKLAKAEGAEADAIRARLKLIMAESNIAAALLCDDDFAAALDEGRQVGARLVANPTNEQSKAARNKVQMALREYAAEKRTALRERYPQEAERLLFAELPVKLEIQEVASKSQKGAYSFAPMLGMLIVIMALTGAFYPAVDLVAGEKERGTMETLLVAPVTRREIVLGKFVTTWIVAMVTALLNLAVMGLTFSKLAGVAGAGKIEFAMSPGALAAVTLILIPTSALFSAVALALSSFATSYKEGQHYLSPLFLVASPLAMVGLLPNIEISYALAFVPVANVVLLVKSMLLGGETAGPALVAIASTFVYSLIALKVTMEIFRRESVLFRSGSGESYDEKSLATARAGLPKEKQAFLLFFTVLALMFFLSRGVASATDAALAFILAQAAVILPTFTFAKKFKLDLRETFALRKFAWRDTAAIVGAAACTVVLVTAFYSNIMPKQEGKSAIAEVAKHFDAIPLWLLYVLIAVLPPICEELMCRGFLLSAFRPRRGDQRAVVLTAFLFAVLHLEIYRIPGTFVGGLVLGYICVCTGSIFASILFHMAYNGILFCAAAMPEFGAGLEAASTTAIALAAVGLSVAAWHFQRLSKPCIQAVPPADSGLPRAEESDAEREEVRDRA
ncbi:MAG: ABC transporter permease subunit/CPBP intramembrane protease [Planctomycetota bacterium]|jgi:sodium transport system permease protein